MRFRREWQEPTVTSLHTDRVCDLLPAGETSNWAQLFFCGVHMGIDTGVPYDACSSDKHCWHTKCLPSVMVKWLRISSAFTLLRAAQDRCHCASSAHVCNIVHKNIGLARLDCGSICYSAATYTVSAASTQFVCWLCFLKSRWASCHCHCPAPMHHSAFVITCCCSASYVTSCMQVAPSLPLAALGFCNESNDGYVSGCYRGIVFPAFMNTTHRL